MNYSIVQSTEGSKYVQVKHERKLRNLGIESCPNGSKESGSKILSPFQLAYNIGFKKFVELKIRETYPPHTIRS